MHDLDNLVILDSNHTLPARRTASLREDGNYLLITSSRMMWVTTEQNYQQYLQQDGESWVAREPLATPLNVLDQVAAQREDIYVHILQGEEAYTRLLSVAAGIESHTAGDEHIKHQLKTELDSLGLTHDARQSELMPTFNAVFEDAKIIRELYSDRLRDAAREGPAQYAEVVDEARMECQRIAGLRNRGETPRDHYRPSAQQAQQQSQGNVLSRQEVNEFVEEVSHNLLQSMLENTTAVVYSGADPGFIAGNVAVQVRQAFDSIHPGKDPADREFSMVVGRTMGALYTKADNALKSLQGRKGEVDIDACIEALKEIKKEMGTHATPATKWMANVTTGRQEQEGPPSR